ncbi:hypothetical protein RKD40_000387 [Streptomyces ambofaciens]
MRPRAAGGPDVLAHQRPVQRLGQLLEDLGVVADQAEERRPPGRQRDRVDQGERPVPGAVQQMGPQGDGTAEVVRGHEGLLQPPVVQQLREDPALRGQGHVLPGTLLRLPVARHVPDEHLVVAPQRPGHRAPDVRGEGRAVQQDQRTPVRGAQPVPADGARTAGERLGQRPCGHGAGSSRSGVGGERHGLRASPPCSPMSFGSSASVSGRHWVTGTTPGSTSSRPSKNAVIWSTVRRMYGAAPLSL